MNQCWLMIKSTLKTISQFNKLPKFLFQKCIGKHRLLTHWGRVTHICVGNLTIIGSDNGLSPGRRQAIIWTNAGILLIGPLGTNFSEILAEIITFSFKKMYLKVSSAKWRPFCHGLNVLTGSHFCRASCVDVMNSVINNGNSSIGSMVINMKRTRRWLYGTEQKSWSRWKPPRCVWCLHPPIHPDCIAHNIYSRIIDGWDFVYGMLCIMPCFILTCFTTFSCCAISYKYILIDLIMWYHTTFIDIRTHLHHGSYYEFTCINSVLSWVIM